MHANKSQRFIFSIVQNMPKYNGGEKALLDFLNANFTGDCDGKQTNFQLVVERDSSISDVTYREKQSDCDDEITKLLEETAHNWIAGSQNGHLVPVYVLITVIYKKKSVDIKLYPDIKFK